MTRLRASTTCAPTSQDSHTAFISYSKSLIQSEVQKGDVIKGDLLNVAISERGTKRSINQGLSLGSNMRVRVKLNARYIHGWTFSQNVVSHTSNQLLSTTLSNIALVPNLSTQLSHNLWILLQDISSSSVRELCLRLSLGTFLLQGEYSWENSYVLGFMVSII